MPSPNPTTQRNWKPLLDPDRIGLIVGVLLATLVMGIGFWRNVSELRVLFRASFTFAVSWGTTFIVVMVIKHITSRELGTAETALNSEETDESGGADGIPVPGERE